MSVYGAHGAAANIAAAVAAVGPLPSWMAHQYGAPWLCPPVNVESRACVLQDRSGASSHYLEETFIPMSIRVLLSLDDGVLPTGEEPPGSLAGAMRAMLGLLEASRLLFCMGRFLPCFPEEDLDRLSAGLCTIAWHYQRALLSLGGLQESICEPMLRRGEMAAVLRALSIPLHEIVRLAMPAAAPEELGNGGTRFDFEGFLQARAQLLEGVPAGKLPRALGLVYPAAFSPGDICGAILRNGTRFDTVDAIDVDAALKRISAVVPLSHFVVNFGTADGACGVADDWNADPANCLARAGDAAVLIEGNSSYFEGLRELFASRSNVSLVLRYLPLDNVRDLLQAELTRLPGASSSPDLLKVDIDHADCLFMAEALGVVSPKLIHLEYLSQLPPPIDYAQRYQRDLLAAGLGGSRVDEPGGSRRPGARRELPGCSLAAFLSRAPAYELAAAGDEEALLVHRDFAAALDLPAIIRQRGRDRSAWVWDVWANGAFCHPLRSHVAGEFKWGFDFRALVAPDVSPRERVELLEGLFRSHGVSEYTLGIATLGGGL
eukprot:TRINITY_DN47585_c0_g1_i1.p1 TRINITY_DN47585_c0_g1~~TRINITY_DN47585_c0_g1_i1.p1  ORF type:complete len:547 (-),score=97.83 TRINITY_DN47585_c0_g1_i1:2-1642(-)